MNYADANILRLPIHVKFTTPDKILLHVILKICHFLFPTWLIPAKKKKKSHVNICWYRQHLILKQNVLPLVCRGCSELYRMPVSDYKGSSSDSGSFEYKFPFRSNNNKWQRTSSSPQQSLTASPQPHTPNRAISLGSSVGKTLSAERLERGAVIPRSVSSDGRPLDTKRLELFGFIDMDF